VTSRVVGEPRSFSATNCDTDLANSYLATINGTGTFANGLFALTNATGQDFLVDMDGSRSTVPVPGALVLGVIGLGLAGWVRKKFAL
jgi:hypothetical protein